jgi:hypothetical protein
MHGGAALHVREAAADRVVEASIVEETARYATPLPTTAREALQAELDRTNGAIAYLARTIERFPEPPQEWLGILAAERAHLARIADKMVGHQNRVEDVEADIRARFIDQLEVAMRGILTDLGHSPDDEVVRGTVALHMRRAAGGQADARPQAAVSPPVQLTAPPPPLADF